MLDWLTTLNPPVSVCNGGQQRIHFLLYPFFLNVKKQNFILLIKMFWLIVFLFITGWHLDSPQIETCSLYS